MSWQVSLPLSTELSHKPSVSDEGLARILKTQTGDRGRFIFEGLAPGAYELSSDAMVGIGFDVQTRGLNVEAQRVVVSDGKEPVVTPVLKARER